MEKLLASSKAILAFVVIICATVLVAISKMTSEMWLMGVLPALGIYTAGRTVTDVASMGKAPPSSGGS